MPHDPRGGPPWLRAAEGLTSLVGGAWRGLTDTATLSFQLQPSPRPECPTLGAYRKVVTATKRDRVERRALLALMLPRNRQEQGASPLVLQDSPAMAGCPIARVRQHRLLRHWARKSKNGMGWWSGFTLHVPCAEAGRLGGFDLTPATLDARNLLDPLTRWRREGIVGGDGGSLSTATATELAHRGVSLLPPTRKKMRPLACHFQLACLRVRHRVAELVDFSLSKSLMA